MNKFKKKLACNRLFELTNSGLLFILPFHDVMKYVRCVDRIDAYEFIMNWFWASDDASEDKPGFEAAWMAWDKMFKDVHDIFENLVFDKDYSRDLEPRTFEELKEQRQKLHDNKFSTRNKNLVRRRLRNKAVSV